MKISDTTAIPSQAGCPPLVFPCVQLAWTEVSLIHMTLWAI